MGASPRDPSTEMLAPGAPAQATIATPARPAGPAPPSVLGRVLGGRFTIVEPLGKGGSGEVYRAVQTQLGRSAVVKILRRDVDGGPSRVERFLREAKLASRLDHPYAAHIYAFGAETDNVLWIAMEHVRGITLDQLVAQRGAIPSNIFAPLFSRLCEVVHSAHELGIVHRDIKGANVMVIERAGQLLPKLLDFGIARDAGERDHNATSPGAADTALTAHGTTLGSPHYMSPEQWERPAEVDARADIYALGVLAYRCLAGRLPFHALDRRELANAHTTRAVPPLPDEIAPPLAAAVMRALAKDPAQRWPSAVAFAEAVQHAAGGRVVEAVPIFDPATRDAWLRAGPQPIADALARLTGATTTVEADAALRELIAITCRWLAVLALAGLPRETRTTSDPRVRDRARAVVGRDDATPWLELARAALAATSEPIAALVAAITSADHLAQLAARLDDPARARTFVALAADVAAAADALGALEALLAYQLVLGRDSGVAESWQGPRRRDRERVLVWGPPLADGEVALLDAGGKVVLRLSPFAQVIAPLPSAEPELFLLWRSGRGPARLVAAPWGFERDDESAGTVLAALSTDDSDTALDPTERSPYPGLVAYGVADADHFVGREREVEALANRLVRAPLVVVLGPSGVGKSSFIHAGLVARLGETHRVLTMRPGRHPMHALAALPPVSGDSDDSVGLAARLRELGDSAQRGLVLVIDQLEELVTLCGDATERRRFAETLATAADGPGAPVRVVATLRDDFATVIESEAALRGRFEVFVLAAPAREALRRIMVEPARRTNVSIDLRVVDDIVEQIAGRPASLPLLSFTAAQLWQTRDREARAITHAAYERLGGVAGALATYADEIYTSLARRDQDTIRDLFSRLVAADGTRVPSPRTELEQLPGAPGVIAHLIDARLLIVRDEDGTDVIEIVHECLAERWPRLARWRSEDAADRALLDDVRAAARRWREAGRPSDLLWRGRALAELERLTARSSALTEVERELARESTRAAQRARRMRRGIVAGAMVVLASVAGVMAYLGVAANESRAQAERSATSAATSAALAEQRLTESLIAQGRRELTDGRAFPALAYFGAAMRRGADSQGLRAMLSIAARGWRDVLAVHRGATSNTVTASPTGWIAAGDVAGTVRWWSDRGELLGQLATEAGPVVTLSRTPDDGVLVVGQRGIVQISAQRQVVRRMSPEQVPWHARLGPGADEVITLQPGALIVYGFDGARRRSVALPADAGTQDPVFGPGSRNVFIGDGDTIRMVDLSTMRTRTLATNAWGSPSASADGSRVAWLTRDRTLVLRAGDGTPVATLPGMGRPYGLFFTEAGDRLAIASERELTIFDDRGRQLGAYPVEPAQMVYLLRGDDAWIGGNDGVLRHYREGELIASVPVHATELQTAALGRDAIGVLGSDGTVAIVRAGAQHLVLDATPCERVAYAASGIATSYECSDGTGGAIQTKVYSGRELLGVYPGGAVELSVALEEATRRAAISGGDGVYVFENGARIATSTRRGLVRFAGPDVLYVAEPRAGLWRWTFATDGWTRLADAPNAHALTSVGDRPVLGTDAGEIVALPVAPSASSAGGEQRVGVGEPVRALTPSWDGRWLAAQLASGATAMIDTRRWQVSRTLPPADNFGAAPTFDASGELLLRTSRQAVSIWDHATGEELVFGLDLMRDVSHARFLRDGRIEMNRREPALLDIPRDTRPVPQILADLDCRVPLEVVGSRLQPKTPACP